jgi:hypothetical protein
MRNDRVVRHDRFHQRRVCQLHDASTHGAAARITALARSSAKLMTRRTLGAKGPGPMRRVSLKSRSRAHRPLACGEHGALGLSGLFQRFCSRSGSLVQMFQLGKW